MASKKPQIENILKKLKSEYPKTKHYLNFSNPLELLVGTILSAQARDDLVNAVTPALFKKYKTAKDYANASQEELESAVSKINYFRNKAKAIKESCRLIVAEHNGKVPGTLAELMELPGIGRKTANAILIHGFDIIEGIVVDTHVIRLSQRMGLTQESNPDKIERDLKAVVPKSEWKIITSLMKDHGRGICGRRPLCEGCVVASLCPKVGV